MELPADLARRIAEKTEGANREALTRAAREISLRYREMTGQGRRLLTEDMEALAYAAARMPATYAAVRTALGEALGRVSLPEGPLRILDVGAAHLRQMREALRKMGAHVAAPCPGEGACPLPETDWCHFTCRVARTRLHKALKGGEAPYEDEKFAYLAVSRDPARPCGARVLRHPVIEPGKITVNFCGRQGIEQRVFRKKDALFKWARKAGAGDCLEEGDATK